MTIKKFVFAILCACLLTGTTYAQKFTVDTLINNGSKSNRINMVFMGDGYTATEQAKFSSDVNTLVSSIFSTFPLNQYKTFFNVYAVHVISAQSGAKHPHSASDCPTSTHPYDDPANYLGSTFDYGGIHRFLMATNTTVINNVLLANLPEYDVAAIVVNTPYYGGASEGTFSICSSSDPTSAETMIHELGHTLAGLGDEYNYGGCGGIEEWNCTQQASASSVRWKAWLPGGVPNTDCTNVGIYQGSNYCPTGWYRPECNCKMKSLGQDFCKICVERFAYSFSYYVNLIDKVSPSSPTISIATGQTQTFTANLVAPTPSSLYATWKIDGATVATNTTTYQLSANSLSNGTHSLVLTVTDTTHKSKATMRSYSQTWTVTKNGSAIVTLNLFSPVCANTASFTLTGGLPLGGIYTGIGVSGGLFNPAISGPGTFYITYTVLGLSVAQPITVYALPNLSVSSGTTVCAGSSALLNASGASTYAWSPNTGLSSTNASSVTAAPSSTTVYTITGTANGCSKSLTTSVTVNAVPSVSVSGGTAICNGNSATLSVSGAATYAWSPSTGLSSTNASTVVANPSSTTTYNVTGASNGCTNTVTTVVTVGAAPALSVSPNASLCSGSSTALSANGATSYTWAPATYLSATTGSTVTATPGSNITYTVTGTTGGCTASLTTAVTVSTAPTLSVSGNTAICNGNSALLSVSGATTYLWSPSTGLTNVTSSTVSAAPSSSTTYSVTGTSNGCSKTVTTIVTVNATPVLTVSPNTTICGGGSATLTASGASNYFWTPSTYLNSTTGPSVTATPTANITYTLIGANGACTQTQTVSVSVTGTLNMTISPPTVICSGATTTMTASGAATYTWVPSTGLSATTGSSVMASPSSTITYTITGSSGGCTQTKTVFIGVNATPNVNVTGSTFACNGTTTSLSASGASTYSWSPYTGLNTTTGASVSAAPASTVTYTVTGTNNGCSKAVTTVLTIKPAPVLSVSPNASVCSGSPAMLSVSGATTYQWSPSTGLSSTTAANISANPSSTTTYTVTGNLNGCTKTASVVVSITSAPNMSTSSGTTVCDGSSTTISASGATAYSWKPATGLSNTTSATITAMPTVSTTYTVTGTNGSCSQSKTIVIGVSASPNISVPAGSSLCAGSSISLSTSGASSYTWAPSTGLSKTTGSSVTASPNSTTTYTLTGSNGGCTRKVNVIINVGSVPNINTSATTTICNGNSTGLIASGATTYTWAPVTGLVVTTGSSVTAAPTGNTTYTVTGSNNGCTRTKTVTVYVNAKPNVFSSTNPTVCKGTSSALSAQGASTYSWAPNTGLTSTTGALISATPTVTTTYTITGTSNGCSNTAVSVVTVHTAPTLTTAIKQPISDDYSGAIDLTLSGGVAPFKYTWSNAKTTEDISNITSGNYTVTVTGGMCTTNQTFAVVSLYSCDTVKGISFIGTTGTSTYVTWGKTTTAVKYILRLRPRGASTWTATQIVPAPNTAAVFTGLSKSTQYEVQIQTQCNAAGTSLSAFTASRYFTTGSARMEEDESIAAQEEAEPVFDVALYPNPNDGHMNILFEGKDGQPITVQVFDMVGKVQYTQVVTATDGANTVALSLESLPAGTYMLAATLNENHVVKRFIKLN